MIDEIKIIEFEEINTEKSQNEVGCACIRYNTNWDNGEVENERNIIIFEDSIDEDDWSNVIMHECIHDT